MLCESACWLIPNWPFSCLFVLSQGHTIFFSSSYRMSCTSPYKVLWIGSGRLWGFLWKRNTTACCLEVCWRCSSFHDTVINYTYDGILMMQKNSSICLSGLIGSLFSLLQFLASPLTGALSDHHGRRPLLILTTVSKKCHIEPLFNNKYFWILSHLKPYRKEQLCYNVIAAC